MPQPNDSELPAKVSLYEEAGVINLSPALSALLVEARQDYEWPHGSGVTNSQRGIIELEAEVANLLAQLDVQGAQRIVVQVSKWAGNKPTAHSFLVNASEETKLKMFNCLSLLQNGGTARTGIDALSKLPGLSLVISSKIYRFVSPTVGASVDRHASYFFNSLDIVQIPQRVKATTFKREWSNGSHTISRLATFTSTYYRRNCDVYFEEYLPLLRAIATRLNTTRTPYRCAITGEKKCWRPTDVEMAAYYWWAANGAK